jgi:hypothetical protein
VYDHQELTAKIQTKLAGKENSGVGDERQELGCVPLALTGF